MSDPKGKKRLLKDIERAQEDGMKTQGILYWSNDVNFYLGEALIQGPPGTPYEGALLHFSFQFPQDYPFSPPKVIFLTCDDKTRLHPNLYKDGKVCLSILGTYSGPGWSGTQSLSTILISILALLDDNPLAHEPAFERGTLIEEKHKSYADAVEYAMAALMVKSYGIFKTTPDKSQWRNFTEELEGIVPRLKELLTEKIKIKAAQPERHWSNLIYGMSIKSDWRGLKLIECGE
jgi:ubiquitin-protein ligase